MLGCGNTQEPRWPTHERIQTPLAWHWRLKHLHTQLGSFGAILGLRWGSGDCFEHPFLLLGEECAQDLCYLVLSPFPPVAAGCWECLCSGLVNWCFSWLIDSNA